MPSFAQLELISGAPSDAEYPHTARWYRQIASYENDFEHLPKGTPLASGSSAPAAKEADAEEDDEDIDLFGSDDEEDDAEAERVKQERVAAYNEAKAAKTAEKLASGKKLEVAKSVVTLQVKPWDDETDMAAMEAAVRGIEKDGLVWGASKLVPVGYGKSISICPRLYANRRYQDAPNHLGHRGRQDLHHRPRGGDPRIRGLRSVHRYRW